MEHRMRCPLQLKYYRIVLHASVLYGSEVAPGERGKVSNRLARPHHAAGEHAVAVFDTDRLSDALTVNGHARDAARQAGDRSGEAEALLSLGSARPEDGPPCAGYEEFHQALSLAQDTAEVIGRPGQRVFGRDPGHAPPPVSVDA
jgi:hypothetical protein